MAKLKDTEITGNLNVSEDIQAVGNVISDNYILAGEKTEYGDGKYGVMLDGNGSIWLQHRSYPAIYFYCENNTSQIGEIWANNYNMYINPRENRSVIIGNDNAQVKFVSDGVYTDKNDTLYLGNSNYKWKAVYAVNGTIQTSDRNQKKNIVEIGNKYEDLFYKLKPVTFELSGSEHDRIHVGFIAQDVKDAMDELKLSDVEFAAYCKDIKKEYDEDKQAYVDVLDENGKPVSVYSLRYTEFIALNTHMIQKANEKIKEQQDEIKTLKDEIALIKSEIEKLK